jgi:hypothetical protein
MVQNRDKWRALVNAVMKLPFPKNTVKMLNNRESVEFLNKNSASSVR